MLIFEIFNNSSVIEPNPLGYSTDADDQTELKLSDVRKTRLTLSQINKLRVLNDIKKLEQQQKLKTLSVQYKPAAETGGL